MRAMLASLLLLISSACLAQAFGTADRSLLGAGSAAGPDFLPVEQAYQLEVEILDERSVRLYWQIAPNYYLYQHRFAFHLEDDKGVIDLASEIPAGLSHTDESFGEVQVFYHSADIVLRLERSSQRATLSATSQGCADAGLCYPPNKQFFELDFSTGTVTAITPPATQAATHSHPRRRRSRFRSAAVHAAAGLYGRHHPQPDALRLSYPVTEGAQLCAQHGSRPTPAQLGLRRRRHCQLRSGRGVAHRAATGGQRHRLGIPTAVPGFCHRAGLPVHRHGPVPVGPGGDWGAT